MEKSIAESPPGVGGETAAAPAGELSNEESDDQGVGVLKVNPPP